MKAGYTLAWSEGTYLTQQHFQYWDAALQDAQMRIIKALVPYPHGLAECVYDTDILNQGLFRLKKLYWISPSGQPVLYDGDTMPIVQCALRMHVENTVYLHWENNQYCEGLSGYPSQGASAQYHVEYHRISDMHEASKTQEIALKRHQIVLSTAPTSTTGATSVPLVRFVPGTTHHFESDDTFMPTAVNVFASAGLVNYIDRMIMGISDKVCALQKQQERRPDPTAYVDEMRWSNALTVLSGLKHRRVAHPYDIYQVLAQLIRHGVPLYRHDELHETFSILEEKVRQSWAIQSLPAEEKVVLHRKDEHHYSTGPVPMGVIQDCDWYLGVSFGEENLTWVQQFVQQVKLSPEENLPGILVSALSGIGLQHTQRPPSSLRLRSGFEYFRLKKNDAYWESLITHQNLTVYLPKPFHTAELSLDIINKE